MLMVSKCWLARPTSLESMCGCQYHLSQESELSGICRHKNPQNRFCDWRYVHPQQVRSVLAWRTGLSFIGCFQMGIHLKTHPVKQIMMGEVALFLVCFVCKPYLYLLYASRLKCYKTHQVPKLCRLSTRVCYFNQTLDWCDSCIENMKTQLNQILKSRAGYQIEKQYFYTFKGSWGEINMFKILFNDKNCAVDQCKTKAVLI